MATIVKLKEQNKPIISNPAIDISFLDMVIDRTKRKCVYAKYDLNYESTLEEDEIFNKMTAQRKMKDR